MKFLGKSSLSSKIKLALDIAWTLSWVGAVIVVLVIPTLAVVQPWGDSADGLRMGIGEVHFKMEPDSALLHSKEGFTAYIEQGAGKLKVNGTMGLPMVLTGIAILVITGLYLFALWQLRRLFRTFVDGSPFNPVNVKRLRSIAISVLLLEVFKAGFSFAISSFLAGQFQGEAFHLVAKGELSLTALFAGAVLFVLAEIFRLGNQLENDAALTV